jgi:cell division protein FtsA
MIFYVLKFTKTGKILLTIVGNNNSGINNILINKSCESIDLLISDIIKPADEELYSKTQEHIKEVIIVMSDSLTEIMQNRGYIVRDSEMEAISDSDITELLNDMYKIHLQYGIKVLNIAPLIYSIDEISNIKDPIGMQGKRLEGKFQILCGDQKLVNELTSKLNSKGINIKKFIPANMSIAEPFLSSEETEALSIIDLNKLNPRQ